MSILSLEFAAVIITCVVYLLNQKSLAKGASLLRSLGLLAFITGLLGQSLGLYQALHAIEIMGGVSPAMLAGGLKISFITSIYGTIIFVVALLCSLALKLKA